MGRGDTSLRSEEIRREITREYEWAEEQEINEWAEEITREYKLKTNEWAEEITREYELKINEWAEEITREYEWAEEINEWAEEITREYDLQSPYDVSRRASHFHRSYAVAIDQREKRAPHARSLRSAGVSFVASVLGVGRGVPFTVRVTRSNGKRRPRTILSLEKNFLNALVVSFLRMKNDVLVARLVLQICCPRLVLRMFLWSSLRIESCSMSRGTIGIALIPRLVVYRT